MSVSNILFLIHLHNFGSVPNFSHMEVFHLRGSTLKKIRLVWYDYFGIFSVVFFSFGKHICVPNFNCAVYLYLFITLSMIISHFLKKAEPDSSQLVHELYFDSKLNYYFPLYLALFIDFKFAREI